MAGRSRVFNRGTKTTIEALIESASDLAGPIRDGGAGQDAGRPAPIRPAGAGSAGPGGRLREEVAQHETAFVAALTGHDVRGAVGALLALDAAIDRSAGIDQDGLDLRAARVTSRSLLVRLAELAADATRDPRKTVAPYVETLLEMRTRARAAHDWAMADLVRERLASAGVEVRDDPEGSTWSLAEPDEP